MINQTTQPTTSDTINLNTLADNQILILNTTTTASTTALKLNNNHHQYGQLDTNNYPNMIYSDMKEGNVFRGFLPQESESRAGTVSTMRVIGEELNTPVINYTEPEFNLYTNSRSTQSLKQQSSGSMLNNNNTTIINSNNITTLNQSSTINDTDAWCSDKFDLFDYQPSLFSPTDSSKSSNSPSGLNSSDLCEESFIFETTAADTNQPVKYSQDYQDFAFVDEINYIQKEFNTVDDQSNFILKIEHDDSNLPYETSNSLETKAVLYHDTMITGLEPSKMLMDEDSYLVTVDNFNDVIIKPDKKLHEYIVSNINKSNNSSQEVCEKNLSDYFLTPAPSPKSPISCKQQNLYDDDNDNNNNNSFDDCGDSSDSLNPVNDMNKASSPVEDRLHLEHNYNTTINPYNNRIDETTSCKRKLVMVKSPARQQEKRARRVPPLKLKIPINMRTLRQDSVKMDVNTPDITNDILEMEDEKFDLISYIISSQDKHFTEPKIENSDQTAETTTTKIPLTDQTKETTKTEIPSTHLNLEAIINEQCPVPRKRRRINSYENPDSVQSISTYVSDDSSTAPTPKRRGRPPKTECKLPSPSMYKHLSESDWKYMEMRNKNNEASRRSRINRKDREHQVEYEARELENAYRVLSEEEQVLIKQVNKWRNAVMKLAQI